MHGVFALFLYLFLLHGPRVDRPFEALDGGIALPWCRSCGDFSSNQREASVVGGLFFPHCIFYVNDQLGSLATDQSLAQWPGCCGDQMWPSAVPTPRFFVFTDWVNSRVELVDLSAWDWFVVSFGFVWLLFFCDLGKLFGFPGSEVGFWCCCLMLVAGMPWISAPWLHWKSPVIEFDLFDQCIGWICWEDELLISNRLQTLA